jgi:hypothetical protein
LKDLNDVSKEWMMGVKSNKNSIVLNSASSKLLENVALLI